MLKNVPVSKMVFSTFLAAQLLLNSAYAHSVNPIPASANATISSETIAHPHKKSRKVKPPKLHIEEASAVEERAIKEENIPPNFFTIGFYKPNYIMPYYYTGSPYNTVYTGQTPNNEKLTRDEIKYQFSLKVPLWKNILNHPSTLYFAYTQLSYWQAYNKSAFFRETDYQPEIFLANEINYNLYKGLDLNFVNVGAEHQSNGFGNNLERSWNRVYIEGIASVGNLMVSARPWFIIHDHSLNEHNPNIGSYLGYMQVIAAYKYEKNVFSVRTYGLGVHGGRRTSAELAWSFPVTPYISGYLQVFSGYGQSLIEYNHRTNSAGIGIALSNWI